MREVLDRYEGGVKIGGKYINNLRYADDTTLICSSHEELLALLEAVKVASEKRGLLLNTKKTKVMVVDENWKEDNTFMIDGNNLEVVQHFEYLGSYINNKGDCSEEIRRRLALARNVVHGMQKLWKSRMISTTLKVRLLRATAFSVATYACESWTLKKADLSRIDAFEMWCYRRVLGVSWRERRTNAWVLEKIGTEKSLGWEISNRKHSFFGHIIRHPCLEKLLL